jgi:hypothetical protein
MVYSSVEDLRGSHDRLSISLDVLVMLNGVSTAIKSSLILGHGCWIMSWT